MSIRSIRSAAVLGAGTMGAQIAAHLANAGLEVTLLDLTAELARKNTSRLASIKPDPFFVADNTRRIRTGGFDDLPLVRSVDWIVEAVVESLDTKQALLARVEPHRAPHAIVSSNTSGLSLESIVKGRSPEFARHWIGTHFFNPPRYLHLVELVPTPATDPTVVSDLHHFLDWRLGKGVVIARDTPGFIANHLGVFGVARLLEELASGQFTIEEIDAITGAAIGRPKSATLRTLDIAGLDILSAVAGDLATRLPRAADRDAFRLPAFITEMIRRGLIGAKAGEGFYKRVTDASGGSKILTLDLTTFDYRDEQPARLPSLDAAAAIPDTATRLRQLFHGTDRVADLLRRSLGRTLDYAAVVAHDIANATDDIDRAMRWGFGWELGPFETRVALGLDRPAAAAASPSAQMAATSPMATEANNGLLILRSAKDRGRIVDRNAAASLVDLGDGVLCVEFHSKLNTIGGDTLAMLTAGVTRATEQQEFVALVVGGEAEVFSAGANLTLLLLEAQEGNWDEIDAMVRAFQQTTMALKTAAIPVIVAPAGLTLGGGCEICLHADRVVAAAETYMGLVEVGVGLIPAGGGTKEMLLRMPARSAFETIGFAKVSTSAAHARALGYLRQADGIIMNRDRAIAAAKTRALSRVAEGYVPVVAAPSIPVGGPDTRAALDLGIHLARRGGHISDHDALIGRKLAFILSGGDIAHATTVSEMYVLDLEREAFLSLCGEPNTLARIAHTLKTGKPLRN